MRNKISLFDYRKAAEFAEELNISDHLSFESD